MQLLHLSRTSVQELVAMDNSDSDCINESNYDSPASRELEADHQDDKSSRCKPFPDSVNRTLYSLYQRGMTGWGKKKESFIHIATENTGLSVSQIQVCRLSQ